MDKPTFNLFRHRDLTLKLGRLRENMARQGVDSVFIASNANKFYLTGRIFSGYILVGRESVRWFVRRPVNFADDPEMTYIRKVEDIPGHIDNPGRVAFELNQMPFNDIVRYAAALKVNDFENADPILMKSRSVKTPFEIDMIRESSRALTSVYKDIFKLYGKGQTDVALQIEIERKLRLAGCQGIFRINGQEMEFHMGSVLVGDNADNPSPYDFAMGGAGYPALPVGANGTVIKPGNSVMIDMNGNFNGYMTDMTRTFFCERLSAEARRAHRLSRNICSRLAEMGVPGTAASELYHEAVRMAREAGLEDRFMGHNSKAGFVGHGVGIVINEWPVLAPRSKDVLEKGNVIAVEPKFVIAGAGAVGVENTYVVTDEGMEQLTLAPEKLTELIPFPF